MAGRFLSLEEAARHLGIPVDEVNRLVDRKKLFPLRDGKFKLEEIDRVAQDIGADAGAAADELTLDIDLSSPSLAGGPPAGTAPDVGDSLALGDEPESIFGGDATPSRTILRGGPADAGGGSASLDGLDVGGDDLALESIAGASSPSGIGATPAPAVGEGSGTRLLDLGDAAALGDSLALGSGVGLSGIGTSGADGPGPALSGVADSGLSLEDVDLAASGIGGGSVVGSGIGGSAASVAGMSLGGDEFNLGVGTSDEESASVVIATEETNDSSFFGAAAGDDSASVSFEESSGSAVDVADGMQLVPAGPQFRVPQIVGLVFCTMLLLTAVIVMVDLVYKIHEPWGQPFASPLLQGLAGLFGWR